MDLNIGFKKALKGTALERKEDVINLQVEEIDKALLKKVKERFSSCIGTSTQTKLLLTEFGNRLIEEMDNTLSLEELKVILFSIKNNMIE